MELFGFEIKRRFDKNENEIEKEDSIKSFVPPVDDTGVTTVAAIDDIVNEAIVASDVGSLVSLNVDELEYETELKRKILNEFDHIYNKFKFSEYGADYFRKWYIDGKIYFHIVVDSSNPKEGIKDLRYVDPINMRKVREIKKKSDKLTGATVTETETEFYVYSEEAVGNASAGSADSISGIKVAPEAIIHTNSGIMDAGRSRVLSHLHKSVKIVNQLRMLEDALVIYRISRAPERRIFYIDVGNLPRGKAEEYVRNMMSQYRNKIVYDADNGEVRDDRKHKSMLEDFFLPRREGGRGTEITTLPGGENLGQIDDILFFQKKLYKSLNVPLSRLESESGFQVGRATEINREEVKFHKFISRLRQRFSQVFLQALKTQLILKGIINEDDWPMISENIYVDFQKDNHFSELKEFEVLRERFEMVSQMDALIEQGYYSREWVRKNILQLDDQEIEMIDKQIAGEKAEEGGEEDDNMFASTQNSPNSLESELDGGELEASLDNKDTQLEDMIEFVD
jgi:hypothetical protein